MCAREYASEVTSLPLPLHTDYDPAFTPTPTLVLHAQDPYSDPYPYYPHQKQLRLVNPAFPIDLDTVLM